MARGSGDEWLPCCIAHDLAAKSIANDLALGRCVAEVSPLMGMVMAVGALTIGTVYVAILRTSRRRKAG